MVSLRDAGASKESMRLLEADISMYEHPQCKHSRQRVVTMPTQADLQELQDQTLSQLQNIQRLERQLADQAAEFQSQLEAAECAKRREAESQRTAHAQELELLRVEHQEHPPKLWSLPSGHPGWSGGGRLGGISTPRFGPSARIHHGHKSI